MSLRNSFPVLKNTTYLNTAGSGIMYESLIAWRRQHDLEFAEKGSDFRLTQLHFLEGVKDSVAQFFNADREHTYLVANFSSGYTTFLNGLTNDHRFLLLDHEFPAVYYPVQSRGVINLVLPQGDHLEERILESIRQFKPTIFAFSMVQYSNGLKLGLDFIKQLKALFPELMLIADGTQYSGTEHFDFSNSALDAYMSSGYKWMLGGYGNGFALLKPDIASRLYIDAQSKPLPKEGFLKHKSMLALRFEPGHQDTLTFGSLQCSINFLSQTGFPFIEEKIKTLRQLAMQAFFERGLLDDYIVKRPQHSSVFRLNIDDALIGKIQEANITATSRGDGLRVSFHFYNETDELNVLLDVIDRNR